MSLDFLLEHASVGFLFVGGRDVVVGTGAVAVVGARVDGTRIWQEYS